jgi:hypothetical protein
MFGLYDKDWNLVDVFDTDEDAMMHAITEGVAPFQIKEL